MIRTVGILCLGLSMLSDPVMAASLCGMAPIRMLDNQTSYGTLHVTNGKRCQIILRSTPGPIHTTQLVANANNGSVSISGNRVTYAPRSGYAGDDHFVYAQRGLDTLNRAITRTVDITVKVAAR